MQYVRPTSKSQHSITGHISVQRSKEIKIIARYIQLIPMLCISYTNIEFEFCWGRNCLFYKLTYQVSIF